MIRFTPEDITLVVSFLIACMGVYWNFKNVITMQEKRLVILEKDIENIKEFKLSATQRLNNHEEQNKALLVLAEQVKGLSEDVRELKAIITKGA